MTPALQLQFERLAAAGIALLSAPGLETHFLFARDGCVVVAERRGESFGAVGSPGLLNESGFAALVQRDGADWFIGKSESRPATQAEADAARRLYRELREILG